MNFCSLSCIHILIQPNETRGVIDDPRESLAMSRPRLMPDARRDTMPQGARGFRCRRLLIPTSSVPDGGQGRGGIERRKKKGQAPSEGDEKDGATTWQVVELSSISISRSERFRKYETLDEKKGQSSS